MIHFEGERSFPVSATELAARLSDASFLVGCLQNVDQLISANADQAIWKLRPGFSFVRGTLEITMDIVERGASATTVKLFSKGIGASATVMAVLKFLEQGDGSICRWMADITEITGLLKMVPRGLMQSAAGKVIEETWEGIEKKLRPAS